MDIQQLMTDINNSLTRIESQLDRGEITPDDLLTDMQHLRSLTAHLSETPPLILAPYQQYLLNLGAQLASLQTKMIRARDGLGEAITDVDKRRKALHNYTDATKKTK